MNGFILHRVEELHWRLKVLENCLVRADRVDVCEEFVFNTADSVLNSLSWTHNSPGLQFWRKLYIQLFLGNTPDFALIRAARRATERLIQG